MEQAAAETLAAKLAGGHWTHDYALTASEACALGLPVKVGMPLEVMALMKLYPQPIQQSGVACRRASRAAPVFRQTPTTSMATARATFSGAIARAIRRR